MAHPIAPPRPLTPSTWQEHRACEWSWRIEKPAETDTAVCVAHAAEFDLPTAAEAYEL